MSTTYGYGDLSGTRMVKDGTRATPTRAPRTGERVQRQQSRHPAVGWSPYAQSSATGLQTEQGATLSPVGWPYWNMLLYGTEPVYRLMRKHPTLSLARYVVTGPVRASLWDTTWTDGIEKSREKRQVDEGDPAIRFLKEEILPLRRKVIRDAVRTIDYGWQPFAVIWEIRNGMYVPDLRPLLPDATTVLQDKSGRFAGLENRGEKNEPTTFNDLESWAPTLDAEAGYAYGCSRYENVRETSWAGWLDSALRLKELQAKISGIVPIVQHPPGGYTDDDGNHVDYATEANTLLNELPYGRGVRLEGALDPREIISDAPEHADKLSQIKIYDVEFLDAGSVTPAMSGFISLLEYWDKLLFRGFLRPERSGLEAVAAGSRADSESHTETGAADSEAIDADLTDSFDSHVVRTALRLNFGEQKARKLHVISTPLLKWKQQVFSKMLERLVSIPELAIDVAKSLDLNAMFSQMSLPQVKDFVVAAVMEKKPEATGGTPKVNENGEAAKRNGAEQLAELIHSRINPA